MRKIHPKHLRFVVLSADIRGAENDVHEMHICKVNLANRQVSKTACGIGGIREAYAFPFFERLWKSHKAPVCEACYGVVAPQLRNDAW